MQYLTSTPHDQELIEEVNLIIVDSDTGEIIKTIGDCYTQESPCSTFKIAISLMGFDSGILINKDIPQIEYQPETNAHINSWKQAQTPLTWIHRSCIWYSQVITTRLGAEKFKHYVDCFTYGNQDVSGDPNKNNGLQRAWLCSSLKVSLFEQVEFIRKLQTKHLPISQDAQQKTQELLFLSSNLIPDWDLYGKTGSGIWTESNTSIAWLVGWANNKQQKKALTFACLIKSHDKKCPVTGAQSMQMFINNFINS